MAWTTCEIRRDLLRIAASILAVIAVWECTRLDAWAAPSWATGSALQRRLAGPVDIVWSGNPLRRAIHNLSEAQGVAVLIDRRVDPDQKLDVRIAATPLENALREVARGRELDITVLGPVVYMGPAAVCRRLRTLAALREQEVGLLPASVSRKFLAAQPMVWADLDTPRDLLGQLARQGGWELAGLDRVPHDLWAAADLPALSLVDRLTLIAVQFDLTFEVAADGQEVRLVPIPERVAIVRSYPGGTQPTTTAKNYSALAPEAEVKVQGDRIYVRGLLEDHERITRPKQPSNRTEPRPTEPGLALKRFTLTVKQKPLGSVLEQLAANMQLELRLDRDAVQRAGISLDQRVSFSVKEVTVDELFRAATKSTGLHVRRTGRVVEVLPGE